MAQPRGPVMEARESPEGPLQLWWPRPWTPSDGVWGTTWLSCPPGRGPHLALGSIHTPRVSPSLLAGVCWGGGLVSTRPSVHLSTHPSVILSAHLNPSGKRGAVAGRGRPQRAALAPRPCVGCGYARSSPRTARAPAHGARPCAKDTGTAAGCWALTA